MNIQTKQSNEPYLQERRISEKNFEEHYQQLSDDQLLSVYTLRKLGYDLLFVRTNENGCKHAILKRGEVIASVYDNGYVELDSQLNTRQDD